MKLVRTIILLIVAILLIGAIGLGAALYLDARGRAHKVYVPNSGTITEEEAIEATQEAIAKTGRRIDEYKAGEWGNREYNGKAELIFARNPNNPNSGYIMWRHESGDHSKTLSVRVNKINNEIGCRVHRAK